VSKRVEAHWNGGLYRFRLVDGLEEYDVSDVTQVTLTRGTETLTEATPTSGVIRWPGYYHANEIVAKLPATFIAETGEVTVNIVDPDNPAGLDYGSVDIGTGGEFVGAAGTYYEQCDVCHLWYPIETLVRQLQIRVRPAGTNYLLYSRYNPTFWSCTADYLGDVSINFPRWRHVVEPGDGPARIADGASSFWGDGVFLAADAVDVTGWTTALLQADIGMNECYQHSTVDVSLDLVFDPGGLSETVYNVAERTEVDGITVWGSIAVSTIPLAHRGALHAQLTVTTETDQEVWWIERLQLQKDATKTSMATVETKGAAVAYTTDGRVLGMTVVCQKDWEPLAKQVNEYSPEFDGIPTIEVEDQEL
jgi:hypothetical protein